MRRRRRRRVPRSASCSAWRGCIVLIFLAVFADYLPFIRRHDQRVDGRRQLRLRAGRRLLVRQRPPRPRRLRPLHLRRPDLADHRHHEHRHRHGRRHDARHDRRLLPRLGRPGDLDRDRCPAGVPGDHLRHPRRRPRSRSLRESDIEVFGFGFGWLSNTWTITFVFALLSLAPISRIVRAQTLSLSQREYVLAARSIGAKTPRDPVPRDPAERHAGARVGGLHRRRHPARRRGRPGLPRLQRRAAAGVVGADGHREPRVHRGGVVGDAVPLPDAVPHGAGVQPDRRPRRPPGSTSGRRHCERRESTARRPAGARESGHAARGHRPAHVVQHAARARCAPSTACRSRIDRGQALGIVGESGSGKTVLSRSVMGLLTGRNVERTRVGAASRARRCSTSRPSRCATSGARRCR